MSPTQPQPHLVESWYPRPGLPPRPDFEKMGKYARLISRKSKQLLVIRGEVYHVLRRNYFRLLREWHSLPVRTIVNAFFGQDASQVKVLEKMEPFLRRHHYTWKILDEPAPYAKDKPKKFTDGHLKRWSTDTFYDAEGRPAHAWYSTNQNITTIYHPENDSPNFHLDGTMGRLLEMYGRDLRKESDVIDWSNFKTVVHEMGHELNRAEDYGKYGIAASKCVAAGLLDKEILKKEKKTLLYLATEYPSRDFHSNSSCVEDTDRHIAWRVERRDLGLEGSAIEQEARLQRDLAAELSFRLSEEELDCEELDNDWEVQILVDGKPMIVNGSGDARFGEFQV
ncbi:hypothetical protein H2200_011227 [Cladophialophora chaetospira]|uniref:Uncharacterized protein n=1 Tax=Cladophialophora chaetospira TaxID=386627 RepID=A0AA38X0A4_9EURO|nr:hypothetical protein H2200_011227 [Cladophialophora chaetospira]